MTIDPETFAKMIAEAIGIATAPLLARIKTLERELGVGPSGQDVTHEDTYRAIRERARQAMVARGVWSRQTVYQPGDAVTHSGSLWTATARSVDRVPGHSPAEWRLAVKRGADGKDATTGQASA